MAGCRPSISCVRCVACQPETSVSARDLVNKVASCYYIMNGFSSFLGRAIPRTGARVSGLGLLFVLQNPSSALNPAILLSDPATNEQHVCSLYSSGAHPECQADGEHMYHMDRSSFIQNGIRDAGVVVVDLDLLFGPLICCWELHLRKLS